MKKVIIFVLVGIMLVTGVIATGTYGLSEEDIEICERAVSIEDDFGFDGFTITDYPVSFYDGDNDYVVVWENGEYSINKRNPVMDFIVATAYPVDEHYEVLTPTIEKMSSLLGLLSMGNGSYGADEHVTTLWHEAFHCYQLTNYLESIESIPLVAVDESLIAENADTNEQAVRLFEQKSELLKKAVKTDDIDKIREYIVEYKKLDEERKTLLSDEVNSVEEYYTRIEGTACYIEACVYKSLLPDSFENNYIETISEYGGGSGKYYKTGMAMCMILDTVSPEWKNGYNFSEPLINLIYTELEI